MEDRVKFEHTVGEVLSVLSDKNDTVYVKGEYFGYFVNRLAKRFLADPDYTKNAFNSAFFNESKKKTLASAADSMAATINRADPIASAAELNYCVSAVLWGVLGEAEGFEDPGYGVRAYLRAMVEKVLASVETVNTGSQRDMSMAFRRHLVIRGVLADVVSETYHRFTTPYEDGKLSENGDIWQKKQLKIK